MALQSNTFKRIFWATILTTFLSYAALFKFVGPNEASEPAVIFSILSILLSVASVAVVIAYIIRKKPSKLTVVAGVAGIVGVAFGVLLCVGYLINL